MMFKQIFLNAFTRVSLEGVELREMQVGNPKGVYPISATACLKPEIDITVQDIVDAAFVREIFKSPLTGYYEKNGRHYYRNCNVANDLNSPDVFYLGRLPNSILRVRIKSFRPLQIDVQCSSSYRLESRSRFSRVPSIDETVNNVLLIATVWLGMLPMHAAAIEIGSALHRRSVLFMGWPNTGKTTTSVSVSRLLGGEYLAEDICFARSDNAALYGGPYTLDETKIQNYNELKAAKFIGPPIGALVLLQRESGPEKIRRIARGSSEIADFISDMNRYEFNWEYDLLVRHLLIGGAGHGLTGTSLYRRYQDGIRHFSEQCCAFVISGKDPSRWAPLLAEVLRDVEIA